MVPARFSFWSFACGLALVLAATSLLPSNLEGQATPGSGGPAAGAQLPAEAQARLNKFDNALRAARAAGDAKAQAINLTEISAIYYHTSDYQRSIEFATQALALYRQINDVVNVASELSNIGLVCSKIGETQKALEYFNQALPVLRRSGNLGVVAGTLINIGLLYSQLGQPQKALDNYNQALPLYRQAGDRGGEGRALNNIGTIFSALGEKQRALEYYNQALPIRRGIGDREGETSTLISIGRVYFDLGEKQKALDYYNQALPFQRQVGDHDSEAATLNSIGRVSFDLGERQKALDYYNQALLIFQQVGDRAGEAGVLGNIGNLYDTLGEKQKALEHYAQVLLIFHQVGDRADEATALSNVGYMYSSLGEKQKALEYYNQALLMERQVGDRAGEARTLNDIGELYHALGERQKALEYYNQALPIRRSVGDRGGEATTLNDIGFLYSELGEKQKALEYYNQALPIERDVAEPDGEGMVLANIGSVYDDLGEKQKALEYLNHALRLATQVSDPMGEAWVSRLLMLAQRPSQPALAIFFGKQSVNLLQQVRGNIQGLDTELQKSFVSSIDVYYHDLADLLIAQGRLPEAEEVLDLLKQQEYSDYVRGQTIATFSPLALTPAEKQAEQEYHKSTEQLVALGQQWAQLKKIGSLTAEQERQYQQIANQLDAASKGLNDYFNRLYVLLGNDSNANKQVADVKGDVSLLKQQIAKLPHTVALYTLAGKDRTSVIVITAAATVARDYPIPEDQLNQKIAALQSVLRDPARDPRPPAQELYRILVGPVQADLDQAEAQTLVWSLDGALRYVPIAALFDGKQYLVEKYSTVTITPASIANLSDKPDVSNLSAAAMGISRKYEEGLPALPAVAGELDDVVKDTRVPGANGVLPGSILLNGQFTEKAMESQLGHGHGVVHIASHFVFNPGDDSQSYLLLAGKDEGGTGYHLTVADFRDNQKLDLGDTDLLTLSACETGMSGNASNGREVDGLGTTAQLKGAKAVISSLWEVNDASTGELMADFYRRWTSGEGKVAKVEALRQAQLDLLLGKVTPAADASGRGLVQADREQQASTGYAHPYYWAPFVLMGNWR